MTHAQEEKDRTMRRIGGWKKARRNIGRELASRTPARFEASPGDASVTHGKEFGDEFFDQAASC